jgi:outer membrane protein TolC
LLIIYIILLSPSFSEKLYSQTFDDSIAKETDSFLAGLPSLETLIDSAIAHAPELKMNSLDIKLKELEISGARKNWTKNIVSGSANFNYGDNLVINEASGVGQINSNADAAPHYSVGFSIKIPIATMFDRQELKKANLEMKKTEFESIISQNALRIEVNNRYSNMINAYQKYKSLSADIESYEIIAQNAEKDFLNSRITVQEITNFKMAFSKAKLELSDSKSNFLNSKWLLEEIIGFRL